MTRPTNCAGCGHELSRKNKTGYCRSCNGRARIVNACEHAAVFNRSTKRRSKFYLERVENPVAELDKLPEDPVSGY